MKNILFLFVVLIIASCDGSKEHRQVPKEYPRHIGDAEFDQNLDSPDFTLCYPNHVAQYFNYGDGLEYDGEKTAIVDVFRESYDPSLSLPESGLLRIRFIVNCQGKTGRFRLLGMDENYNEKVFDISIIDQVLNICRSLDGWNVKYDKGNAIDYYQYLIFKFEEGEIVEIMP